MEELDESERIVAIGLLNRKDLTTLGSGFRRLFWLDETPCFEDLLGRIDVADAAPATEAEEMPGGTGKSTT